MDKSIEKKHEEKYHAKQIKHIHDTRRQINMELEGRRSAKLEEEHEVNLKKLHNNNNNQV